MRLLQPQKLQFERPGVGPKKGDNGRVLVVGGSQPYVGAAYLAAMAALRSGADYVTVAAPRQVSYTINELTPDLVTIKLTGNHLSILAYPRIKRLVECHDVLLLGNGAGLHPNTRLLMRKLARLPILKVLDADAIKALSMAGLRNAILTPHSAEFAMLYRNTTRQALKDKLASRMAVRAWQLLKQYGRNTIILLKGETDYVITKQEIFENPRGNPRMRVAGTGDVLAGTIAGVLAQTKNMYLSISVALPAVCRTADKLYQRRQGSYTASELLTELHKAIFI